MDTTKDLKIGQVVKSKAGRDKGMNFVVFDILDDEFCLLCDGNLRKIDKPKKKKVKHLMIYKSVLTELADEIKSNKNINDALVRRSLEPFNSKSII